MGMQLTEEQVARLCATVEQVAANAARSNAPLVIRDLGKQIEDSPNANEITLKIGIVFRCNFATQWEFDCNYEWERKHKEKDHMDSVSVDFDQPDLPGMDGGDGKASAGAAPATGPKMVHGREVLALPAGDPDFQMANDEEKFPLCGGCTNFNTGDDPCETDPMVEACNSYQPKAEVLGDVCGTCAKYGKRDSFETCKGAENAPACSGYMSKDKKKRNICKLLELGILPVELSEDEKEVIEFTRIDEDGALQGEETPFRTKVAARQYLDQAVEGGAMDLRRLRLVPGKINGLVRYYPGGKVRISTQEVSWGNAPVQDINYYRAQDDVLED